MAARSNWSICPAPTGSTRPAPTKPSRATSCSASSRASACPTRLLIVVDASNLDNHLRFTLQLIDLGLPTVVALNMVDLATRDGLELDAAKLSAELGVPVIETVAVRKRGLDAIRGQLGELLLAPRTIRAGDGPEPRPAHAPAPRARHCRRRDRPRNPGAAHDASRSTRSCSTRSSARLILAAILFVMFQAVFAWSAIPADALEAGTVVARQRDRRCDARRRAALADRRRAVRGGRRGDRLPAADPDPVPLHPRPRIDRLHGPRGVPDGPADEPCRPVGARLHPLAVELRLRRAGDHGDAHDRRSQGPADDDPRRAADDLLGAAAGLHADHRRLHPGAQRRPGDRAAGPGAVRAVRRRRRRRLARRDRHSPHRGEGRRRGVHDGIAQISDAAADRRRDRAVAARGDLPQARRRRSSSSPRSSCGRWRASPSPGPGRSSPTCRSRARSATRSTSSSRRSASTRTSASPCSRRWRRAKSRSRRSPRSIRSTPPTTKACRRCRDRIAGRWSLATALAFLAWFVFAPQCISTIAVTRRETNGWKWPLFMVTYLFVLAYLAAGATYWTAVAFGLG